MATPVAGDRMIVVPCSGLLANESPARSPLLRHVVRRRPIRPDLTMAEAVTA